MSRLFVFLFILTPVVLAQVRVDTVKHHSTFLQHEQAFLAIVPEGIGPWPVLYLLHGAGGNYTNWAEATDLLAYAEDFNMLIITPDGGKLSWYLDSPFVETSQYESYMVNELLPFVDSTYTTRSDRQSRGIAGLSMGGHGAISLACKYPELFGSASSLSGVMDIVQLAPVGAVWNLDQLLGPYNEYPGNWRANSCYYLVPRLQSRDVKLLLDCGLQDIFGLYIQARAFQARCDSLGIACDYNEYPGGHTWDYWDAHIYEHLVFHNQAFTNTGIRHRQDVSQKNLSVFPNPFNSRMTLNFNLQTSGNIRVDVFDLRGRRIARLWDGPVSAGALQLRWNAVSDAGVPVASGLYMLRLQTPETILTTKVIYAR